VIERLLEFASPPAGAVVMGTGIVAVALSLDGRRTLFRILFGVGSAIWIALAVAVPLRAARDRARLESDLRTPAALTAVAGTAVVGAGAVLLGWELAGVAALVLATVAWGALIGPVLAASNGPATGATLMLTVSTESLSVLAALVALRERADWLLVASLAPFVVGLVLYALVMLRFELAQLGTGWGDHWITGGALAISTLALATIAQGAKTLAILGGGGGTLEAIAVGLWVLTILWLPVLVACEAGRPRLRYDVRRWSTVFPVGMYAACSFAVGRAAGADAITSFARVWVWVAVAVWVVVFAAMLCRGAVAAQAS
jgi:tellurite resistance protein TehA-like permease